MLFSSIVSLAVKLPAIAVLVAGLVLASTRRDRLPGRARALLSSGAVVLLVVVLVTLIWSVVLSGPLSSDWVRSGGYQRVAMLGLALDVVTGVGYPLGFGLLVGAALAGRRPAGPPVGPVGPWAPPGTAPAPTVAPGWAGATPGPGQWGPGNATSPAPGRD
ncbi:hypothetical protein GA0074695_1387 [Micromonospora viridifaciens]|uniref:Uncharacterized protein n=1 Tax=Micromonospora viridifaciens TaxID=1881 RepID=A0A1C4VE76_MICVI|nr:hypothetical protein [Micromonospora viridifaciens]SCE82262.1 hypothetical protein GA0074695_1387 [Micromonospora viridifaciens]